MTEHVRFGIFGSPVSSAGKTVAELRNQVQVSWGLPPDAVAFCGTRRLRDDEVIPHGAVIEFHRRFDEVEAAVREADVVPCHDCARFINPVSRYVWVYAGTSPVQYYCTPCWEAMHSDETRDQAILELVELLAAGTATISPAERSASG